ncbi:MAG: 16S rRNA (guanine(966)-N(2))-methyltransferase RsmD [Candidatus Eisenbacteria bacterium]
MRVIAGRLRGSVIRVPAGGAVRPTYDRVRESVFSIIEPHLDGASVLDLFAGSGSLGIESLSRGATFATFVEKDRRVLDVIRENVERLGLAEQCRLIRGDAPAALERGVPGGPFDIVFVDPPYSSGLAARTLELLASSPVLAAEALVVVERASTDTPQERAGRLGLFRSGKYGSTAVDFYGTRAKGAGREEET